MPKIMKSPRINVVVTPEIISEATREDSGHCMIADAVKEAAPWARHVSVDIQTIRFSDPTTRARYVYLTPRLAQEALLDFDAGDEITPFKVQLRNPHITTMQHSKVPPRPRTEAQQEQDKLLADQRRETLAKHRGIGSTNGPRAADAPAKRGRTKMTRNTEGQPGPNGGGSALPRISGGKPPPVGVLAAGKRGNVPAARRRQYGLRALDRGSSRLLRDGKPE